MKNFIPFLLLCSISMVSAQSVKEVRDVIKWSDFEGEGISEFYIGEAHYTLQYYIKEKLDDDVPSFFFLNPNFLGGLLISTNKSEVTKLELKWNDTDQEYEKDMYMYVTGSDSPWESVKAVMDAKPESQLVGKFRYYAYDKKNEFYGDEPETVVIPSKTYKHYAITPGYIGSENVRNYVFEFIISRQISTEGTSGFTRISSIEGNTDTRYNFLLSTESGKVLYSDGQNVGYNNLDVTTDGEIYADFIDNGSVSNFKLIPYSDNSFRMFEPNSSNYLTISDSGKLTLSRDAHTFSINNGVLTCSETGQEIGFDGTEFVLSAPLSRASSTVEPLYLFRSNEPDIVTGVESITAESDLQEEFFTLQGIQLLAKPTTPGFYIRRQGNKTSKFKI
ncbi:MAG: hypothetical protein HDS58_01550 [Barnesiella sp.]|nr:hypothetical protein [Barnesiella sp.]